MNVGMNKHTSKKIRMAYECIKSAVVNNEFSNTQFLPSMEDLGRLAHVSRSTMWHAINALKKEGLLFGDARHRISLIDYSQIPDKPISPKLATPPRQTKSLDLQRRIQDDILNGRIPHGAPLPGVKELTIRYGINPRTLRKALLALSREFILEHLATKFYPLSISAPTTHHRSRIVLLGYGTHISNTILWGYWHQEYLKMLEMECAKAGMLLDVICFARDDAGILRFRNGRTEEIIQLTRKDDILGYIYEVTGTESIDDEILQTVSAWERPVAILDEVGTWPSLGFLRRHPNIRVFRNTVSDLPARQVARFVLELGHRSAVYISPFHQWEYSQRRLRGLQQSFASVNNARLIPITSAEGDNYVALGTLRANLERMTSFYTEWRKALPSAYVKSIDNNFALLPALCGDGRVFEDLDKLMEQAMSIRETTAWIMVNDTCAHRALDFLREHRIFVPGSISVISFDDQPESLMPGITSYDFNQPALVTAMLGYITSPRLFSAHKPVIEIEGKIIPRRTTGPLC